jgi:hypothetical protein
MGQPAGLRDVPAPGDDRPLGLPSDLRQVPAVRQDVRDHDKTPPGSDHQAHARHGAGDP